MKSTGKEIHKLNVPVLFLRLASVAGAVIQAIGRPEFEDVLRTSPPGGLLVPLWHLH